MQKSVLIIDDHSVVRLAVKIMLKEHFPGISVDEVSTGAQALELVQKKRYDLVIMDFLIPETDTTLLVESLLQRDGACKILVFSMMSEGVVANRLLQLGVKGFLSKDGEEKELLQAVELIMADKKYISAQLNNALIDASLTMRSDDPFANLSARERDVLRLLLKGKTPKEIKQLLHIEHSTVGTYKIRIFEKMKVTNIVDLLDIARLYHFC